MKDKDNNIITNIKFKSKDLRKKIFDKFLEVKQGHPGSVFSIVDLVSTLFYGDFIRIKDKQMVDRFVMSKGHATSALYPVLVDYGVIEKNEWDSWGVDDKSSILRVFGNTSIPGISVTTGSLGIGIGVAAGIALADKMNKNDKTTYVVISEGELYEGCVWETLLFIKHYNLDNLKIIIDINSLIILGNTNDCLNLNDISKKINGLGYKTVNIDGHDHKSMYEAINEDKFNQEIICLHTIKGKGVSLMENDPFWHYWQGMSKEDSDKIKKELEI